jgi:hypothetical protein
VAATAFDHRASLVHPRPDSIPDLVEPHIKMIVIHAISERTSHKTIEKPKIFSPSEGAGIVPVVFPSGDLRKGLIDGDSQFFSRQSDFQIHDRGL